MIVPTLPFPSSTSISTSAFGRVITEGCLVIVYENPASMKGVYVRIKDSFCNRFGAFPHKDWIGKPFGSKVFSRGGSQGWVQLLAPTPELWSLVLLHRTQILYVADISMVCMYLELSPGAVVLESGTGSGSLTHSLVRAVAPAGHVHTFEFHAQRAEEAAKEFTRNGLSPCVTVRERNIEERGFPCGAPEEEPSYVNLTNQADAVFLDLPAPQKAVPSAAKCLRPNGRFCSFSPCVEQVQRTCEALECNGFTDIKVVECLLRLHEVRAERLARPQLGAQASSKEKGRPDKRRRSPEPASAGDEAEEGVEQGQGSVQGEGDGQAGAAAAGCVGAGAEPGPAKHVTLITSRPAVEARGHSGYLTFARKWVGPAAGPSTA